MSAIRKEKYSTLPPEWCAAVSAAMTGKSKTPEHIAATAAAQRGKKKKSGWWSTEEGRAKQRANNPGHTGHHHSEETKAVLRAARARQPNRLVKIFRPTDEMRAKTSAVVMDAWASAIASGDQTIDARRI
jgi:hypothetical protein